MRAYAGDLMEWINYMYRRNVNASRVVRSLAAVISWAVSLLPSPGGSVYPYMSRRVGYNGQCPCSIPRTLGWITGIGGCLSHRLLQLHQNMALSHCSPVQLIVLKDMFLAHFLRLCCDLALKKFYRFYSFVDFFRFCVLMCIHMHCVWCHLLTILSIFANFIFFKFYYYFIVHRSYTYYYV